MSQPMDHESTSPPRSSVDLADGGARKRVGKACDRCRLKKSKCDGTIPCLRCKQDNMICQFGERKKSVDKVYPKGYVEILEQHFEQMAEGLRECYRLLQEGRPFPGPALAIQKAGYPLTHDMLDQLGALKPYKDCSVPFDGFEETPELIHSKIMANKKLITDSEETTPDDDEPKNPMFEWNQTTTAFQNPWQKPTTMQLRMDSVQQHQRTNPTPAMFLNQVQQQQQQQQQQQPQPQQHQHQAMSFTTPMAHQPMLDMSMQMDATPVAPPGYDPVDASGLPDPMDASQNLTSYQWAQVLARTPGVDFTNFNWNSWLIENPTYMPQ